VLYQLQGKQLIRFFIALNKGDRPAQITYVSFPDLVKKYFCTYFFMHHSSKKQIIPFTF